MAQNDLSESDPKNTITRAGYWWLAVWALGLLLLYSAGGYAGVRQLLGYKTQTERIRQTALEFPGPKPGGGATGMTTEPATQPVDVRVGMSLDRISEAAPREAAWTADFHIWFRWTGDAVDPGKHFQIANGRILEKEEVVSRVTNGERYEQYRVTARMIHYFEASRFPLSDETLAIEVEDAVDGVGKLRYVSDERSADIGHIRAPQNWKVEKTRAAVIVRDYGPGRVDSDASTGGGAIHSLFVVESLISVPAAGVYLPLFQALFASVAICMIVFFIKPIHVDPRFGLPVGAFFAAVSNNISVASLLPPAERVTLVQMINAVSLGTIFLTLVESAVSLYLFDSMGRERYSRLFDRVSFAVLGIGYVVLNLILPLAARS
jgi:hypothetical protein